MRTWLLPLLLLAAPALPAQAPPKSDDPKLLIKEKQALERCLKRMRLRLDLGLPLNPMGRKSTSMLAMVLGPGERIKQVLLDLNLPADTDKGRIIEVLLEAHFKELNELAELKRVYRRIKAQATETAALMDTMIKQKAVQEATRPAPAGTGGKAVPTPARPASTAKPVPAAIAGLEIDRTPLAHFLYKKGRKLAALSGRNGKPATESGLTPIACFQKAAAIYAEMIAAGRTGDDEVLARLRHAQSVAEIGFLKIGSGRAAEGEKEVRAALSLLTGYAASLPVYLQAATPEGGGEKSSFHPYQDYRTHLEWRLQHELKLSQLPKPEETKR